MAVPSSLLGLLLFVLLLWPGFAYSTIRGRRMPERQTSALRETVSIVAISLTALTIVLAVFAVIRLFRPDLTPSVRSLFLQPEPYLKTSYAKVAWWALGMMATAVIGSSLLAALLTSTRVARAPFIGRLVAPHPSTMSAWWMAFSAHNQEDVDIHVGCTLDDGSYVSGRLYSYSQTAADVADRELLLSAPIKVRAKGATELFEIPGAGLMAVSARHLVTMTVSYVNIDTPEGAPASAAVQPDLAPAPSPASTTVVQSNAAPASSSQTPAAGAGAACD